MKVDHETTNVHDAAEVIEQKGEYFGEVIDGQERDLPEDLKIAAPATASEEEATFEVSKSLGYVSLDWLGCIDNGEGDGKHGPYGSLHIDIYAGGKKLKPIGRSDGLVVGRHKTNGHPGEWLDGDGLQMKPWLKLYKWKSSTETIKMKIWESDPGPGRGHDVLVYVNVARRITLIKKPRSNIFHHAQLLAHQDAIQNTIRNRKKDVYVNAWLSWMEKNRWKHSFEKLMNPPMAYFQMRTHY